MYFTLNRTSHTDTCFFSIYHIMHYITNLMFNFVPEKKKKNDLILNFRHIEFMTEF